MSHILDALRRAEAERQRGHAPGLPQVVSPAGPAPARSPWRLIAGGLLLSAAALAAAGWWGAGRWGARPSAAPLAASSAPSPTLAARPPQPMAPVPSPAPAAPSIPAPPSTPAALAARAEPASPTAPARALPAPVAALPSPSTAPPPRAPTPRATSPAAPGLPAAGPIAVQSLPEPQRSQVQQLSFGGAVQSSDRAQSFVMLNGLIVREGEAVAPGITVERIGAQAVQLRIGPWLVIRPL